MSGFDRIYMIEPREDGWAILDGETMLAKSPSQQTAIKCAAVAAMTAQVKGYTATFRMAS